MQTSKNETLHQFISVGFNKNNKEDSNIIDQLKIFCKERDVNRSQFIKTAILEKLAKATR